MIRLENVTRRYLIEGKTIAALDGVSLDLERGEEIAVVGSSGSGKTTLLHLLGLLLKPDGGRYLLAEKDVYALSPARRAALRAEFIGFVFQDFHLNPRFTALENVELPLLIAGMGRNARRIAAGEALRRVGLWDRRDHLPRELSGGQQQRVAIARATVRHPPLILADEPTGNLDPEASDRVLALLREENRAGAAVVMITHDPRAAASFRRVVTIDRGKLIGDVRRPVI
ncbi:MAG: ABC transporter ATP-binding protein [Clostridia bacterium]|nr:ABC transporter ATP-binding protein [Clostridia bacterium]